MKKLIFIVSFFGCFSTFSQDNILVETDIGAAIPIHHDLKDVFNVGFDASVGAAFNLWNKKLYLKPSGGVTLYQREVTDVNSLTEHLRTWKTGIEVRYYVFKKGRLMMAPYLKIGHNWSSNYYSASSYNPITNKTTSATSNNFLEGKGYSFAGGAVLSYQNFYFKIEYQAFAPSMKINQTIVDEAYSQGIIVDQNTTLDFSSLSLSVGYKFKIKK